MSLTSEEIAEFAKLSGDLNPLHHDKYYAKKTRFKEIIACGPHIISLMMAIPATHFSKKTMMVGLEFSFRFHKAIKAGETIDMEWEIIKVEPKASLQGVILTLDGKAVNQEEQVAVTCMGKILVTKQL